MTEEQHITTTTVESKTLKKILIPKNMKKF